MLVACAFMPFAARADDFNITYELNGGTAATSGMSATYTGGTAITLGTPTRVGSTFVGWCTDAELTDCANPMIIGADATGDKTFYASWTCDNGYGAALDGQSCVADEYTVTYDCGDGTGAAPANATATYNANFSPVMIMKNLCEKPGYVLSGWLVSGTSTVQSGTFKWTYTGDKTLTAQWVEFDPKFTITTTNMSAGDTFKYWQGAEGLFYVDWGDGTQQTINYVGTIEHTYATAGVHTIRFGGLATDYIRLSTDYRFGTVSFGATACDDYSGAYAAECEATYVGTPEKVAGISGSLGAIYPSLSTGEQPQFVRTFGECTNLTGSIPSTLFNGVTGNQVAIIDNPRAQTNAAMFLNTFYGCSGLTGPIPADLFGDLNNAATSLSMFQATFSGCSGLTGSIPAGLFSGVTGIPRAGLFHATFNGCSGLTGSIPENLFATISGSANDDITSYTMSGDATYTRGAVNAFGGTFANCENLTGTIPARLFSGITGAANRLFRNTFQGTCRIETPIPSNLFAGVSGTAKEMFQSTFNMGNCGAVGGNGLPESSLTGYIDPQLFAGVTGNSTDIFGTTFRNTRLDAECPCGAHSVTTAWGIDKIPSTAYNPADDPTGKDVPRAVCAPGLKDGEHYYTDGNGNTVCTTDCDFATEFKTKNGENENAYPILSERMTTPALVVQSGGTQCFVPLEMGVDTFNLNWGENVYHAGRLDEVAINP